MTSLRFVGQHRKPLALATLQERFTIGAGACDLVISRDVSKAVSNLHAVLERSGAAIFVNDQQSKNGSYRWPSEPRQESFLVHAGDMFWLADVALQALDEHLELLRPEVAMCVGLSRAASVDSALQTIASCRPLVLLGPRGTGAARLARAIHDASLRRNNFFLEVTSDPLPSLTHAVGGTVFVDLQRVRHLPEADLAMLFDERRAMRSIFAAHDERAVRRHLDRYRDRTATVELAPLAGRVDEIWQLLAILWVQEQRSTRRVEDLGSGLNALRSYAWPRNLDELREAAPRLLAVVEHGSLRLAAQALQIRHQTLSRYFQRLGFPVRDRTAK